LIPVGCRTSRTYDRNLVAIQKFNISANIEHRRRIINFAQTLRVLRLVPCVQPDSGGLRLGSFLDSGAERLARVNRLRNGCRQAMRFQFGERSVENPISLPIALRSFPAMRAPRPGVNSSANDPK
jgi:hypothetical protein